MIALHVAHEDTYDNDGNPVVSHNEKAHRFVIMERLADILAKYKGKYGPEVVLACDASGRYWRKDEFKYYKARRKAGRDQFNTIDWPAVFDFKDRILEDMRTFSAFKVVEVPRAEGDDVAAVLALEYGHAQPILIVSRDKDYTQLMQYGNISIHCPDKNRLLAAPKNPQADLLEHIIRGDTVDDIPNVLSDDNVFVTDGLRQVTMTAKRYQYLVDVPVCSWDDPEVIQARLAPKKPADLSRDIDIMSKAKANMTRNQNLIDLRMVPDDLRQSILDKYNEPVKRGPRGMFDYFYKYSLTRLMDKVSYF